RRSRLKQYAESHGCSFCAEGDGIGFAVSRNIFSKNPSKEYKFGKAANIIQGSTQGLRFTYFEKALIEVGGDSAEEAVETRSIVAIDYSANDHFASGEVFDKDLVFYRENGKICFWWNGINSSGGIPVKLLAQWLADIASAFKTGK
ncbi:MAG TPA: hypothetical protein VNB54_13320, partial [Alphaproteobacteria bacterium]|nr:hypothetical protein [Alphaproteobacteria bacterium]